MINESKWDDLSNYRDSLEHYGRKGMHWYQHIFGERQGHAKYADKDGGSKNPQRKRQAEKEEAARIKAAKKEEAAKLKAAKKEANEQRKAEKELEKKEAERKKILGDPKKLYAHRDEFTYDEIKQAMDKFKWEDELRKYSSDRIKSGSDFVQNMANGLENGIKLYNQAARIVNTLNNGEHNAIPFIKDINSKQNKNKNKNKNQQQNQ